MSRQLLWLLLLVPAGGCMHTSQVTWKIDDTGVMKTTLSQRIPPGTSVSEAQQFMEHEGFACTAKSDDTFVEHRGWYSTDSPRHEGLDCVQCRRFQTAGFLVTRYWNVALAREEDTVTNVLVSHFIDGP